uniref:Uncharacterized protein n=1 Tax=Aegilops tauschii subsp. strangulata TaxID=200361 RepID=A0A453K3U9_AEGTS
MGWDSRMYRLPVKGCQSYVSTHDLYLCCSNFISSYSSCCFDASQLLSPMSLGL